jgi:hypothetical protein
MRRTIVGIAFAACLAGGAVRAADVVEFADGRYLEVQSHSVLGDFIRLEVRTGSYLVFPATQVDEIRRERLVVYSQNGGAESGTTTPPLEPGAEKATSTETAGLQREPAASGPAALGG